MILIRKCKRCGESFATRSGNKWRCGSKLKKQGCSYFHNLELLRVANRKPARKSQIQALEKVWKKKQRKLNTPYAQRQRALSLNYVARNKQSLAQKNKEWRKKNLLTILFNNRQRILSKRMMGKISPVEWMDIKRRYNYRCAECGATEMEIAKKWAGTHFTKLTLDHVKPLSRGGMNLAYNGRPLCISCNCKKRNSYDFSAPILSTLEDVEKWRSRQYGLVIATNGVFDVVHHGHVHCLKIAKKLGATLIVGMNSDASVRTLKGPTRPINNQEDRAEVMSSFWMVDALFVFEGVRCHDFLKSARPNIYVKGGDYRLETLDPGERKALGDAEIVFIPVMDNVSTTAILQKI